MIKTYHIEPKRLSYGEQQLSLAQMQPLHRERVGSTLSKHLLGDRSVNRYFQSLPPKVKFDFTIDRKGAEIQAGGKTEKFSLEKGNLNELRKMGRVVQFYQHVGVLPSIPEKPKDQSIRRDAAVQVVKAMSAAAIPGANGKILTMSSVSENTLSLARDILRATPAIGPSHPLPQNLAFPAGAIWAGFAFREVKLGWNDYKRAEKIEDGEGRRRAIGRISTGGFATVGSGFFLAANTARSAGAVASAAMALSFIADIAFGIGSLIGMGLSSLGIYRCYTFKKRLDEYYENPLLTPEQRIKGTIGFLHDLLIATPEEKKEILEELREEHPEITEDDPLFREKLAHLTEKKVKFLKRRTSNRSLELIINNADRLLTDLSMKKEGAMEEAIKLIETVRKDCKWKLGLYTVGLIASIISFIGVILADISSLGSAPFIVMGVASFITFCVTGYNIIMQLINKPTEIGSSVHNLQIQPLDAPVN